MKRAVDKTRKHKSNILVLIVRTLLILFIVLISYNIFLLVFSAKTEKEAKYLFGFRAYVITTDSMKPTIKVGDIVIIQNVDESKININDVVTYRLTNESERITHRILDRTEEIYITKGDNNRLEDKDVIKYENIEGKVIYKIPALGKMFLKTESILYFVFLSLIILTAYLYNRRLIMKSKIRREKKKYADRLKDAQEIMDKQNESKQIDILEEEER